MCFLCKNKVQCDSINMTPQTQCRVASLKNHTEHKQFTQISTISQRAWLKGFRNRNCMQATINIYLQGRLHFYQKQGVFKKMSFNKLF